MEAYLRHASTRLRLVLLVDGKVGATPLDVQAYAYLTGLGAKVTVVATKIDQVSRGRRMAGLRKIRDTLGLDETTPLLPVSAHSGEGTKELWGALASHLEASAT